MGMHAYSVLSGCVCELFIFSTIVRRLLSCDSFRQNNCAWIGMPLWEIEKGEEFEEDPSVLFSLFFVHSMCGEGLLGVFDLWRESFSSFNLCLVCLLLPSWLCFSFASSTSRGTKRWGEIWLV